MSATTTLATVNSFIRTIIATCVLAAISIAGWLGYDKFNSGNQLNEVQEELANVSEELEKRVEEVASLNQKLTDANEKVEQLKTAMHLLKVDSRVAELRVVEQNSTGEREAHYTIVQFVELDGNGHPIAEPKSFFLRGTKAFVDYWVVKFRSEYVESADLNRSTSICLFRRIFGEFQQPAEGNTLDQVGSRPKIYARGRELTEFEEQIWNDFWSLANDPVRAEEIGIRAAHGEVVYMELKPGTKYRLEIRSSDGMTIVPKEDDAFPKNSPAS